MFSILIYFYKIKMDNFYEFEQMNFYNNNNFEFMNLDPFGYMNGVSYGNKRYLRDQIMPEAKNIKKKKRINSVEENIEFLGNYNNFNSNINKINNNFGQRKEKKPNLNLNVFINHKNEYMNLDSYNPTEIISPQKNHNKINPFIYKGVCQQHKKTNNNNILNRNLNNQNFKNENVTLKKNINNKMNKNIPNKTNKFMPYQLKNLGQKNQFKTNMLNNQIIIPPNINMNNNIILNNNINHNEKYPYRNNLRDSGEIPNYQLRKYKEKNDIINKNNTIKKNNSKNIINNVNQIRKGKIIKDKPVENEEDESLSNIAEEIYNAFLKKTKKNIEKKEKKQKKEKEKNQIINNKIKNNDFEQVFNISISYPPKKLIEEVGCQVEFSKSSRNSRRNSFSDLEKMNKKEKEKDNYRPEKVDIGIGIQLSLLRLSQFEVSPNNEKNVGNDKKLNSQIKVEKTSEKENLNDPYSKNDNKMETKEQEVENLPEIIFKDNLKDDIKGKSIEKIKSQNTEDDFKIGENLIESGSERENEEKKVNKKNRRIKIDLNNNIYFNFLKNDIINKCQVRKGILGDLEYFNPKKEGDIFDSRIVFIPKASIKPYNKDEIKLDKDYKFRENMTEKEIVPDLFEIDENLEIEDNVIEDIRNSLRGSIDKSIDASVNESLRRSINHSYNQSMRNSLMSSINTEGQGILRRLKLAFEGSVNKEV